MNINELEVLKRIVDYSEYIVYLKDVDGKYLFVNESFRSLFNLSDKEVVGRTDFDIFDYVTAGKFLKNDAKVIKSKEAMTFEEVLSDDKARKIYSSDKFPYFDEDGDLIGVFGISVDVSESRNLQDEIKSEKQRYSSLVSNIEGVAYRCDTTSDWKMRFISDYIYVLSGYNASDFIMNASRSFASIIMPEDRAYVEEVIYENLKNKTSYELKYRIICKDGSVKWMYERGRGYYEDNSDELFLAGIIMDITKMVMLEKRVSDQNKLLHLEIERRLEYEEKLKMMNDDLEKKVAQRTFHLNKLNAELSNALNKIKETNRILNENMKMAAIGTLIKGISHKISTPLGVSLTINTHIKNKLRDLSESTLDLDQNNLLNDLMESVSLENKSLASAIDIIDKLRIISDGEKNEELTTINMLQFLENIKYNFVNTHVRSNCSFDIECDSKLNINTSFKLLEYIFRNFISNTIVHASKGEEFSKIKVKVSRKSDLIVIEYSDDGIGVDVDILDNIFEPFFTTDMGKMSGLGLYSVYIIVTYKLNGSIKCHSSSEKGTRFIIEIPVN